MIDLYFWTTPNGYKPLIMLEETGLDYRIVPVNISAGAQFEPEFLKISPNNRIPAIVDYEVAGTDEPVTLFESGAILTHLGEKTGRFLPAAPAPRAETLQWLFWQIGGVGPMFGQYLHFADYAPEKIAYGETRYRKEAERLFGVLDRQLENRPFVAGDYSIADISIYPWVCRTLERFDGFENVARWSADMALRPAVIRAYELGAEINTTPTVTEQSKALLLGLVKASAA